MEGSSTTQEKEINSNGHISNGAKNQGNTAKTVDVKLTASSGTPRTLDLISIVKRNGMLVPFRKERIFSAIESAFRGVKEISSNTPLPQELYTTVQELTHEVVEEVKQIASRGESLTVEGIQDLVELKLMQGGHYEIAKGYIIYRDEHKSLRDDSPRNMKVTRRDGTVVRFNPIKIATAIESAFRASLKIEDNTPQNVIDTVNLITNKVVAKCLQLTKEGKELEIEFIQDEVEKQMMMEGYFRIAKDFIIYRALRASIRESGGEVDKEEIGVKEKTVGTSAPKIAPQTGEKTGKIYEATDKTGKTVKITESQLRARIEYACRDYGDLVSSDEIFQESLRNFYPGIKLEEVDTSNIMAARVKIEKEPAYSQVTAQVLLDVIYRETIGISASDEKLKSEHESYFLSYIEEGIKLERLSPELRVFDLKTLAKNMKLERDQIFTYLGLQTLYDRYLIHQEERRLETPQIFWMRVAMGLSLKEGKEKNQRALEFYDVLSQFHFMSSTPTLFNSGTMHSQMSSCYLSTISDDLHNIFKCIADDAQLSKWAGGLGNDWTNVRATGARIKGTNGKSQGVIPFLKVANDTAVAVNQGGKRKGAMCAYLETWHLDIEDFMELRKNTGDERRRTHDMNTANWIPDLFMKRVAEQKTWTLFSPSDTPDLHDLYGNNFEKRYEEYERKVETGEIKLYKKIDAVTLWRKILSMLFETGHPWVTFKDPSNIRSPQDHVGVVHSSNLCTEILLNTSIDETAVCNLGSVNLAAHTDKDGLNEELVKKTVKTAIRMLDNVIDINFYPTKEAENSNLKHRPIGLGLMGFQDALYKLNISYASPEAVEFADTSMEMISYYAILSSSELAKERGAYSTYKGSKWDRGMLPIDTLDLMKKERGAGVSGTAWVEVDTSSKMNWGVVREAIKNNGMRNSNTMAIAPTATISNITGVIQSIEPSYKHLYSKSNLSGEFIVHNTYLVDALKAENLWDHDMIDDLKYFDGSILEIDRIPDSIKKVYLTAFEIEPEWLIECASRRQKWIDMGQSLNLYIAEPSGKRLNDMYMLAWKRGLKTTYYLRSLGATQIEKSTTDINRRGLQPRWMKNKSASSNIEVNRVEASTTAANDVPKVCNMDEGCESCQ